MNNREKIGLLGGAFDPVHNGHLELAAAARRGCGLDRVIFVPAAVSPYKTPSAAAPGSDRLAMLRLALAGRPGWSISEIELDRGGISYTIDTLRTLRAEYGPGPEFHLIIGMDNFLEIAGWRDIESLAGAARFIVAARPGFQISEAAGENKYWVERIRAENRAVVIPLAVRISSSGLREMIRAGGDPRPFLPPAVTDYIREKGLYGYGK